MALQSYFFQFNVTTGAIGTTYAQSGFGFQPKACIIWANCITGSSNAFSAGSASMSVGFVGDVATERRCITSFHTKYGGRGGFAQRNDCCLELMSAYNAIDGLLDVDSIGADGITFIVDDVFISTYTVQGIAFGGSDITAVDLITLQGPTSTGNWDTTSLGYTPSIVFFANTLSNTENLTTPGTDGNFAFGAANDTGQFSINIARNSVTSGSIQSMRYGYSGECYSFQNSAVTAISGRGSWVTSLSTGFRLNHLEGTTAYKIFALCIKGGQFKVGKLSTRTDGADIAVTGLYGTPTGILFASHCTTESTQDTANDHAVISIGAAASTSNRGAMAMSDEDALTYTAAEVARGIYVDEVYMHPNLADSVDGYMDLKSLDANGFTCVMDDTDVQANVVFYVAGFTELSIWPSSIATSQVLGTPIVTFGSITISPSSIASLEAFGTPTFALGAVTISPTGIATGEALGTAVVSGGTHLLVSENFETPGYEESWSETLTGGTITDDSTGPGSLPVGGGSRCCRINHTDGTGDLYTVRDLGTQQNIIYTRAYFYVDSHALASGESAHVFSNRYAAGTSSHIVRVGNTAGQLGLDFRYYTGGAWVNSASANISADTWYCIETKYDITNLAWSFSVDGSVIDSGSLTSATRTSRYLYLGNNASTIPDTPALDVYFDYVKVDNAGPIGAEKEILPSAVATAEAFGTAVVTRGGVTVQPTGIATAVALGTAVITRGTVTIQPSAIASSEAIGTATVGTSSATQTLLPSGIAMPTAGFGLGDEGMPGDEWMPGDAQAGQALGTPVVTQESPALQILPSGISTGLEIGTAVVTRGSITVQPTGIVTGQALGVAVVTRGSVTIQPSSIASSIALGTAVVTRGSVTVQPTGIASPQVLGTAVISCGSVAIQPTGITTAQAIGTPLVTTGQLVVIPSAIASMGAFGTPALARGAVTIQPTGISTAQALGTPLVTTGELAIVPAGIATSEALGTPVVARGAVTIQPTGVVSAVALGAATLTVGGVSVQPTGIVTGQGLGTPLVTTGGLLLLTQPIASSEAFGVPVLATGAVTLLPASIGTAAALGTPGISTRYSLFPAGIGTSQALGVPVLSCGLVTLLPAGITSSVAFGTAQVSTGYASISPSGIATAQALGVPVVTRGAVTLLPLSIAGAAALGTPVLSVGQVSVVPTGIASAQAIGTPNVARTLHPVAISSLQALGVPILSVGAATVHPTGIASSETLGDLRVDLGIQFMYLSGIASSETFGATRVIDMLIGLLVSIEIEAAYGVDFEVEADYSMGAQTEDDHCVSISA